MTARPELGGYQPTSAVRGWQSRASALIRSQLPLLLHHRRTVAGVGAYFDLITDDFRRSYGDSFHLGYFPTGTETLSEALDALTDLVIGLARITPGSSVLDIGCGIGEPAIRTARRHQCRVVGINASREQIRQGRLLVQRAQLAERIDLRHGNALALQLPQESFGSILCLEAAADICVTPRSKERLVNEIWRVLRHGGDVGFCDLAFTQTPSPDENKAVRALLYHTGSELVEDWPAHFRKRGFSISDYSDLHPHTLPTWDHVQNLWTLRAAEMNRRYGKIIAHHVQRQVRDLVPVITRCGTYPSFSAHKPA